jgi:hypothetical protein
MGTIHGENAYSVWDRVVNDLEVPTTSFKATDIVVTCSPIRKKGTLQKFRRMTEVTEVGKHWKEDPEAEGGFTNIFKHRAEKDDWELNPVYTDKKVCMGASGSEFFKKISARMGLSFDEIWNEINIRAKTKKYLVDMKQKFEIPALLESEYTVPINNQAMLISDRMKQEDDFSYDAVYNEWKKWADERYIKPLVARKKKLEEMKEQKKAQMQARKRAVAASKKE